MHLTIPPAELEAIIRPIVTEAVKQIADSLAPPPKPAPLLYDADASCELLGGISAKTLWSLTDRGEITPTRIGARVFYSPEDLQAFVEKNRTVNQPIGAE